MTNEQKKYYARVLLMGHSGTFKTGLALQFADPKFLLMYEGQAKIPGYIYSQLQPNGPIAYWIVQSEDRYSDIHNFTAAFLNGDGEKVNEILSKPGRNASPGEWTVNNTETFIDDGLLRLNDLVKPEAGSMVSGGWRLAEPKSGRPQETSDVKVHMFGGQEGSAYPIRDSFIRNRIDYFRGRPCHYIMTCRLQIHRVKELESAAMMLPLIDGKALPHALPDHFGEIYIMSKKVQKDTISFWADSEGDGETVWGRTSLGVPAVFKVAQREKENFESGMGWNTIKSAIDRAEGRE